MKKILTLIIFLTLGVAGFLYFNPDYIVPFKVSEIKIYNYNDYKNNKSTPFIKLDKKDSTSIIINTINSSKRINSVFDLENPNYVVDVVYTKGNNDTFFLWINKDSDSGIFVNTKDIKTGNAIPQKNAKKLKTLFFQTH